MSDTIVLIAALLVVSIATTAFSLWYWLAVRDRLDEEERR